MTEYYVLTKEERPHPIRADHCIESARANANMWIKHAEPKNDTMYIFQLIETVKA